MLRTVFNLLYCLVRASWQFIMGSLEQWFNSASCTKDYVNSCRLYKIIYRQYNVQYHYLNDTSTCFMWRYVQNVHPEYVLSDNITFCTIQNGYALFLQLPKPLTAYGGTEHWNLTHTFYSEATHVLSMPLDCLTRLADQVGEPKLPVVFLATTGHCGSSLLARIIQNCGTEPSPYGHVLSLSEPDWPVNLYNSIYLKKLDPKNEHANIIRSALYLALKPIEGVDSYFVKLPSFLTELMPTVLGLLPQAKAFYLMRKDKMATIRSMDREFGTHVGLQNGWKLACMIRKAYQLSFCETLKKPLLRLDSARRVYGRDEITLLSYQVLHSTFLEFLVIFQAERLLEYQRCSEYFRSESIYYEHLLQDPVQCIQPVIKALRLDCPMEYLTQKAQEAMGHDSKLLIPRSASGVRQYKGLDSDMQKRITNFFNTLNLMDLQ